LSSRWKILPCAALGLAACLALIRCGPAAYEALSPPPARELALPEAAPGELGAAGRDVADAVGGETGRRALFEARAPARPRPPREFALEVAITDEDDRPLSGAEVFIGPQAHVLNRVGETDAEGRLKLRWRGWSERMSAALLARNGQADSGLRRVELRAGRTARVALGLPGAGDGAVLVFALGGDGGAAGRLLLSGRTFSTGRNMVWRAAGPASPLDEAPEAEREQDGGLLFVQPPPAARPLAAAREIAFPPAAPLEFDGGWEVAAGGDALVPAVRTYLASVQLQFDAGTFLAAGEPLASGAASSPVERRGARVSGTVRDELDAPVAGALVQAGPRRERPTHTTRSGDDGTYALEGLAPGQIVLVAGGGSAGLDARVLEAAEGAELSWDARLERGIELRGRLLDEAGEPLAGWIVEADIRGSEEPYFDQTTTDAQGRYAIPNLPRGTVDLMLRPGDAPTKLPAIVLPGTWPGLDEEVVRALSDDLPTARLSFRVTDAQGASVPEVEARLWQLASGRGAWVTARASDGVFQQGRLPAGRYCLVVGSRDHGWVDAGAFRLAAGEELDLGDVRLPAPGDVALVQDGEPRAALPLDLRLRRADVPSRLALDGASPVGELRLPAGEYDAELSVDGLLRSLELSVRPGAETVLDLAE